MTCTRCRLLRGNSSHPEVICVYCALNVTSRERDTAKEAEEKQERERVRSTVWWLKPKGLAT